MKTPHVLVLAAAIVIFNMLFNTLLTFSDLHPQAYMRSRTASPQQTNKRSFTQRSEFTPKVENRAVYSQPEPSSIQAYSAPTKRVDDIRDVVNPYAPCDDVEKNYELFKKNGECSCPASEEWLNKMAIADPNPNKFVAVVGCSKGAEAVSLLNQYDTSTSGVVDLKQWRAALVEGGSHHKEVNGACGQLDPPVVENMKFKPPPGLAKYPANLSPKVHCIEALPGNARALMGATRIVGLDKPHGGHDQALIIHHLAVSNEHYPKTELFPEDVTAGIEHIGIGHSQTASSQNTSKVNVNTVDLLFADVPIIDMLLIDTEGHDPVVLMASARTLLKTRYLEFEVHWADVWARTPLSDMINFVDNLGFDCFWMHKSGALTKITHCFHEKFDAEKGWGNVACAKYGDVYWKVLTEHAALANSSNL